VPKLLITSRMQTRIRGTSRCCGGGFAKQVAGNVEKGETATLLRERLEIRLDENLHGLFAGIDLHPNRQVTKVYLVPSSVRSSNDGVGHCGLAFRDQWRRLGEAAVRWTIEGCCGPLPIDQSNLAVGTR
jgi:hypothetical protein